MDYFPSFLSSFLCVYRCIRGVLKGKLVVLVTHQLQFAQQADKILAIKDVSIFIQFV